MFDSQLKKYRNIREVGKELNSKILNEATKDDMKVAFRALGLLKGNRLILNDEEDMNRCYDFLIHDYRNISGENLVQRYLNNNKVSVEEREIIDASLLSDSSLYKITGVDSQSHQIELLDLLNPDNKLYVFDFGFSSNPMHEGFLVYSRIIHFEELNMTAGAALVFEAEHELTLLQKYPKMIKKEAIGNENCKRSAVFFKLFKKVGFHQMFYV